MQSSAHEIKVDHFLVPHLLDKFLIDLIEFLDDQFRGNFLLHALFDFAREGPEIDRMVQTPTPHCEHCHN
jgi:hypothetical protein